MIDHNAPVVEFREVSKRYSGTTALDSCSMVVNRGEVLGLVGKNGAGKSTLLQILLGATEASSGQILIDGEPVKGTPQRMQEMGISMVYQKLNLASHLTVEENVFLGRELSGRGGWFSKVRHEEQRARLAQLMHSMGIDISPDTKLGSLKIDARQLVAIIRAIAMNARVIALDEPTASLSREEKRKLFDIITRLKEKGISFIFVSHHLNEVFEITDRIVVLRDGRIQGDRKTADVTVDDITELMLGKDVMDQHRKIVGPQIRGSTRCAVGPKELLLRVSGLCRKGHFSDVSFDLHEGEILGITGLMGSGKDGLAESLFGCRRYDSGEVFLGRQRLLLRSPADAIRNNIACLSPDRIGEGIIEKMGVAENITVQNLTPVSRRGVINEKKQLTIGDTYIRKFDIKTTGCRQSITALSGGNQQKVLFARLMNTGCNILILCEPTNGIDVMTKEQLYKVMLDFVSEAPRRAIIMVSSEVPEAMAISSRILVMKNGRIEAELSKDNATELGILSAMQ